MITDCEWKTNNNPWEYKQSTSGFFLPEVYENLTNILYSDAVKKWEPFNNDGSDPAWPQGQVIMISEEAREKATGFLREFYDWLWTGELEAKIKQVSGIEFTQYSFLWHLDYPGFDQDWHNDVDAYPDTTVTTFQVYMAQDDSKADSGVLLNNYRPFQWPRKQNSDNMTLKQVSYTPNQAWCFTASKDTWHAVDEIDFYRPSFMCRNFKK